MSLVPVEVDGRSAGELLAWGQQVIEAPLWDAVSGLPVAVRSVVGYHFGWWDRHGRPVNGKRGKAFRPTLVLLSAAATGEEPAELARVAAAVELVHNFSLVHDDVMDGDRTRHHRPTVWHVFGVDQAILVGDAMLALATGMVAGCAGAVAVELLGQCVVRLCEGQCGDLRFERQADVTLPECLDMVAGKTSALLECSCALGAVLAGADARRIELLRAFGRDLGVAFQLADDLLGIWGDSALTGKPIGADLARRKKTLPVVAALASGTAAGRELATLYRGDGPLELAQVERAAGLVEAAGGRAWARAEAASRLAAATAYLDAAGPMPRARAELVALTEFVTRRDR